MGLAEIYRFQHHSLRTPSTQVDGEPATGGGLRFTPTRCRRVVELAKQPRQRRGGDDDDDADSSSDAEVVEASVFGCGGAGKVVDTDDEASAGTFGSSSSEDELFLDKLILAKPLAPRTGASHPEAAATGASLPEAAAKGARRSGFEPLWQDPYFTIWSHPNVDFVRAIMRDVWRAPAPAGMGAAGASKQVTARHYGEGTDDPVRSVLLLRAWSLWRAAQGGWAASQRGRARHFEEQEVLLERDIKSLHYPGNLLGHQKANSMLRAWLPHLVDRLQSVA